MLEIPARYIEHHYDTLPESSTALQIEPSKLALVIIDMQNDFLSPGSMFEASGADIAACSRIVDPIRRTAEACRRAGAHVIKTMHTFRPDRSDVGRAWRDIYDRRVGKVPPGAVVGPAGKKRGSLTDDTWNAALIDELAPQPGDVVVDRKHKYTAFFQTDLELILRTLGVEYTMFCGVTTSVCVESSLRDAFFRDFICLLLEDGCWEKSAKWHEASAEIVKTHFGYVTSSVEVLQAVERMLAAGRPLEVAARA